eukprot:147245-Lingulodinium_polyedra.AAC.1
MFTRSSVEERATDLRWHTLKTRTACSPPSVLPPHGGTKSSPILSCTDPLSIRGSVSVTKPS